MQYILTSSTLSLPAASPFPPAVSYLPTFLLSPLAIPSCQISSVWSMRLRECFTLLRLKYQLGLMGYPPTCWRIQLSPFQHPFVNCSASPSPLVTFQQSGNVPASPQSTSLEISLASNYRPISLLSIPSKILERIVHTRHLIENSILSPRQFDFQPGSLTQEALLTATYDWQSCLDQGLSTAALFLNMSKAFDKVPHHNLLLSLSTVV